jgi:zinc transporter ZupT
MALFYLLPSSPVALGSLLGLAVGMTMFLGAILVFACIQNQSKAVLSATQYFSSGILIAVIGQELLPDLQKAADGIEGSLAIATGFAAGVFLMYGVEHCIGEEEEEPAEVETTQDCGTIEIESVPIPETSASPASPRVTTEPRRPSIRRQSTPNQGGEENFTMQVSPVGLSRQISPISVVSQGYGYARRVGSTQGLTRAASSTVITTSLAPPEACPDVIHHKRIPWGLTLPIYIDAMMDGMLIGLMSATSRHGAVLLALATAVEMGFLGITFGALVMRSGPCKWLLAAMLPLALMLSGAAGAAGANALASVFEVGITAFGIAALLFLACNELLKEASENMGESSIFQSGWLFVGFLAIIMLERVLPEEVGEPLSHATGAVQNFMVV